MKRKEEGEKRKEMTTREKGIIGGQRSLHHHALDFAVLSFFLSFTTSCSSLLLNIFDPPRDTYNL